MISLDCCCVVLNVHTNWCSCLGVSKCIGGFFQQMTSAEWHRLRQFGMSLVLVLVVVSVVVVRGSTLPVPAAVSEIDENLLEPGDILFVDIYNSWSQGGYWDHIAVYVEDPYPCVVEATYNGGISQTQLVAFLRRICRRRFL